MREEEQDLSLELGKDFLVLWVRDPWLGHLEIEIREKSKDVAFERSSGLFFRVPEEIYLMLRSSRSEDEVWWCWEKIRDMFLSREDLREKLREGFRERIYDVLEIMGASLDSEVEIDVDGRVFEELCGTFEGRLKVKGKVGVYYIFSEKGGEIVELKAFAPEEAFEVLFKSRAVMLEKLKGEEFDL